MKIKPGFILREMSGEYVVVAVGEAGQNFNGMLRLNETGAFLWRELVDGAETDELARKMARRYEGVSAKAATPDIEEFLESIRDMLE